MTWFSKAIHFLKKHAPPDIVEQLKVGEDLVENTAGFAKLSYEMLDAGVVNLESEVGKTYRAITGTGKPPVFNAQEGPLKSSVSLQDLAQISKGAYGKKELNRKGYSIVVRKEVKDLGFSIYESTEDGHLVVSFRGSQSFNNWKRNLDFRRADDGRGNKVHHGFKSAWDTLKPYVDRELFEVFGHNAFANNVTFTGHSLGGAIAQLATSEYTSTQNPRLIDGVTFAAPVVGDDGFNNSIPGGHLMNVADPRDSVPKIVQQLQPSFKENKLARRWIAVGDRAARKNDSVKKDAIRFGIELGFDVGAALIMAYAPGVFEGAAEAGPEVEEAVVEGALALEEGVIAGAEEAFGVGASAETAAELEAIGGSGESFSAAERFDLNSLFNASSRGTVRQQLSGISMETLNANTLRDAAGAIDWESTIRKTMTVKGVSTAAQNLMVPFITENTKGADVNMEKMEFLMNNGWDYMYGTVVAHPVDTYIKNINTRFGSQRDNARDDMWNNYQKNLRKAGLDDRELLEFMTEEELAEYQDEFFHGDEEDTEDEDDEDEDEDDGADDVPGVTFDNSAQHALAGHEANEINGRPLHVMTEGLGKKANGERIFGVVDEKGNALSYSGPTHPASTTTLFGRWTGVAPFANDQPVKVQRQNAFGGQSYSALDTFSMAYLVNSYTNGYHNADADQMYMKRIMAAINNGFISESIDSEELRISRLILLHFNEKGHLFGVEDEGVAPIQGNMLTQIDTAARGGVTDITGDVEGVRVAFGVGEKRKIESMLSTSEGTQTAHAILSRDSKRLKSRNVSDLAFIDNSTETIDFNLKALKTLGLDKGPEYSMLLDGAKQNAHAYKTALNVESTLSDVIRGAQAQSSGNVFESNNPDAVLPNVMHTTPAPVAGVDDHLGGNEQYFKDLAVASILKAII